MCSTSQTHGSRPRASFARHIASRYAGDPYQNVKRWVPEKTTT